MLDDIAIHLLVCLLPETSSSIGTIFLIFNVCHILGLAITEKPSQILPMASCMHLLVLLAGAAGCNSKPTGRVED